ncbi:MAG: 6-phosphogluconolactonase [Gemmatimonadota bacterium]
MGLSERGGPKPEIVMCPDSQTLVEKAVGRLIEVASRAIAARDRFAIALSGGTTPKPIYESLARFPIRRKVDWDQVEVFWSDERCVPPDDERSNYRMSREALLDRVGVPEKRVHRIRAEDPNPDRVAAEYERTLRWALGNPAGRPPRIDLVLLGLGAEGHTASLFPGSAALDSERLVFAVRHAGDPPPRVDRITLTPKAINAAREVVFLAAGEEKAEAVRATLEGPRDPTRWPVQAITPVEGHVTWIVDQAAASKLTTLGGTSSEATR